MTLNALRESCEIQGVPGSVAEVQKLYPQSLGVLVCWDGGALGPSVERLGGKSWRGVSEEGPRPPCSLGPTRGVRDAQDLGFRGLGVRILGLGPFRALGFRA